MLIEWLHPMSHLLNLIQRRKQARSRKAVATDYRWTMCMDLSIVVYSQILNGFLDIQIDNFSEKYFRIRLIKQGK